MLQLFRLLTQLRPRLRPLPQAPYAPFARWCIGQGLGPLAGHNLAYALPQLPAPREVRDSLLSVFQGTLADNTLHLVNFKKAVQPLEGRRLVLFGAFSMAEALYPHVGFRPLQEASLLLAEEDMEGFSGYLRALGYEEEVPLPHAACALSDGCTTFGLFRRLPGMARLPPQLETLPKRVFGPSVFALGLEDSLLALCARQYAEAYTGPWIDWIDMREIWHASQVKAQTLKAKAKQWGIAHAVYASLAVLKHLFEEEVESFQPEVPTEWKGPVSAWAKAYAALPEAVEAGQPSAQEAERRLFEEVAARACPHYPKCPGFE